MPPIDRLLIVAHDPAGTRSGTACARQPMTAVIMRCEVSAAQPATGWGTIALRKVVSGITKSRGANMPELSDTSGQMCFSATAHEDTVAEYTLFIGPVHGSELPVKSTVSCWPRTVTATSIRSGTS